MDVTNPELLTVPETARLLRVTPETVRRLARRGELPAIRVGTQLRFDRDVLTAPLQRTSRRGANPDNNRLR
jgi:excisionase family DNA binding protein